jgi:YfiR/HmsC-like
LRRTRRIPLIAGLLAALTTVAGTVRVGADVDVASDVAVKAAFLYNFAKFTQWPALPAATPLVLCVLGDDTVGDALTDTIRGQQIDGHGLGVRRLALDASPQSCHVLFAAGSEVRRASPMLDSARLLPILTVSDGSGFAQTSGMIELFVEGGHMRFAVNVDSVQRSGLRLSSRLLGLAKIVGSVHAQ